MQAIEFNGSTREYFKIWIVNVFLIIVTLGIYYPWAKVRNKRYFYANTNLEDRNFEYHATGKQLLVGYLIAITLIISYIVLQNIAPLSSGLVFLVLAIALPWVIVRSMGFNMKMTSFSNVHFSFDGAIKDGYTAYLAIPIAMYIMFFVFSGIVAALTSISGVFALAFFAVMAFGIYAMAIFKKYTTTFLLKHSKYGTSQFTTELETKNFMSIALNTMGLSILLALIAFSCIGLVVYLGVGFEYISSLFQSANNGSTMQDPEQVSNVFTGLVPFIAIIYFVLICVGLFAFAYKTAKEREYIYENTLLDAQVKFRSTLQTLPYGMLLLTNFLAMVCTLGLATPWVKVRTARYVLSNTFVDAEGGFNQYITEKTKEESSIGEQIGDAFDVDVGI